MAESKNTQIANQQGLNIDPSLLEYSWTANVRLNNWQEISMWYTCWASAKDTVKEILSISSDLPRHVIDKQWSIKCERCLNENK